MRNRFTATGDAWPTQLVPLPKTCRGSAGKFLDHRAAEHIFYHHIRVAHFARRRFAALRADSALIKNAALPLAFRDRFRHATGETMSAIGAEGGDGEQMIFRLKG